jgi:hypothetical protein
MDRYIAYTTARATLTTALLGSIGEDNVTHLKALFLPVPHYRLVRLEPLGLVPKVGPPVSFIRPSFSPAVLFILCLTSRSFACPSQPALIR